jgi:hypothetical protein
MDQTIYKFGIEERFLISYNADSKTQKIYVGEMTMPLETILAKPQKYNATLHDLGELSYRLIEPLLVTIEEYPR